MDRSIGYWAGWSVTRRESSFFFFFFQRHIISLDSLNPAPPARAKYAMRLYSPAVPSSATFYTRDSRKLLWYTLRNAYSMRLFFSILLFSSALIRLQLGTQSRGAWFGGEIVGFLLLNAVLWGINYGFYERIVVILFLFRGAEDLYNFWHFCDSQTELKEIFIFKAFNFLNIRDVALRKEKLHGFWITACLHFLRPQQSKMNYYRNKMQLCKNGLLSRYKGTLRHFKFLTARHNGNFTKILSKKIYTWERQFMNRFTIFSNSLPKKKVVV